MSLRREGQKVALVFRLCPKREVGVFIASRIMSGYVSDRDDESGIGALSSLDLNRGATSDYE